MRGIFSLVKASLSDAELQAFDKIVHYLGTLDPESSIADQVANSIYDILVSQYKIELSSRDFKRMVTDQTSSIYKELVKKGQGVPARTSFALPDARAMKYLDESSLTFLDKYVTSPELEARVKSYIKKAYLEEGKAIGNNPKAIDAFLKVFKGDLNVSKDAVRNIIDTTVSRARVFGQVNGLRAAAAKTYTIAGPDDNVTCSFCEEMLGRTFTVASAVSRQDSLISAGPANVNDVSPFLKGNMSLEEVQDSTDEELEAAGFALPPYHGSCRHRLVVDSFYGDDEEVPYDVE